MSREIIYRTSGQINGLITRLTHPNIQGKLTKSFLFLEYINGHSPKSLTLDGILIQELRHPLLL